MATRLATPYVKKRLLRPGVTSRGHATKLLMRPLARARAFPSSLASMGVVALAVACTSPTLPLPPPAVPSITQASAPDRFKLSTGPGGAEPNALIIVVNRDSDLPRSKRVSGTLADEQGGWELEVFASAGDFLDISQESGTTRSPTTTVQVR